MPQPNALRFCSLVVLALAVVACNAADGERTLAFSPGISEPQSDGSVKLQQASRPYVKVIEVRTEPGGAAVRAPGRVAFRNGAISKVDARVGGSVVDVHVKVGDRVSAGDALLVLSSPDAAEARAELASATAEEEEARRDVTRHEQMQRSGVDIPSEKAASEAKLREAIAELDAIRAKSAYLGPGDGPTVVIKAPISGTILSLDATPGSHAEPGGDPILEIANTSATWFVADVFERDLPLVTEGAKVKIDVPSVSRQLVGHVVNVGAAVEGSIRTAPVYVSPDEETPILRAGMYARVTIDAGDEPGISLPVASVLVKDGTRTVVYVETAADSYTPRDVKVGASIDGRVRVLAGLRPGEKIVSEGALLLDGAAEQML